MKTLLTLDVGTTAVKAGVFTEDLKPLAFVIKEYTLDTPAEGYVELAPAVYWASAKAALKEATQAAPGSAEGAVSITCTAQGETLIPIGRDGLPLHNAVVWLDSRAKRQGQDISAAFDKLAVYQKTGLPEVNGFSPIAKLLWFKQEQPELYARTEKFLLLEDYLVFMLSGRCVTNPGVQCSTGYFDIFAEEYWADVLRFCGVGMEKLPAVQPCGTVVGPLLPAVAAELDLPADVRVTTGAMDQVASAVGSGNVCEGMVTETTGTCQVVAATCNRQVPQEWSPVAIYSHAAKGMHLRVIASQTAGIIYKWFRDEFCVDLMAGGAGAAFAKMDELAAGEPPLSRGLVLYPHLTGMQFPKTDEAMRGVFFGVGLDTGRSCFLRAVLEGVGYMLRESIEAMRLAPRFVLALGGGAKSGVWCQIKADICGVDVRTLADEESTSLGAAMLGAVATGLYGDLEALGRKTAAPKGTFAPGAAARAAYETGYREYQKMYASFAPLFDSRE